MNKKNISIKEIAKLSGVSVATVSRVINNNGRFSEQTRKKVQAVIEATNYETNAVAKSLRMKKSNTVGILIPDIRNAFFSTLVQKLERYLFEQGYSTIICNTGRSEEKEAAYLAILNSKMIDGLIVISGQTPFSLKKLTRAIPVVCIDRKPKAGEGLHVVHSDNHQGGVMATETLLAGGSKNLLLLTGDPMLSASKHRRQGFVDTLKKHGFEKTQFTQIEITSNAKQSQTELAKEKLLEKAEAGVRFDGVFALNDRLALGAIEAAYALDMQIPQDVQIVGFDDDPISRYCSPKLSTVKQNTDELAQKAGVALLKLMAGERLEETQHIVCVEWIQRETTR